MNNPFQDFCYQIQNNETVSNQPIRSTNQKFIMNTVTTTVHTLSRRPLALLDVADIYSLSNTNNNSFQTITNLNANANPCQM